MAGTFSSIFNSDSADATGSPTDQPFEPENGGDNPPPSDDGSGPPPEIAGGFDGDAGA